MATQCPKCQSDNPPGTVYCGRCGSRILGTRTEFQIIRNMSPNSVSESVTKTLEAPADDLPRGTLFGGRYEIIETLGEGGMGKVYRAFDTRIKEEVAIKLLRPEISADRKVIERFSNELKFARQITHKNVCRTHDMHEEGKTLSSPWSTFGGRT